MVKKVTKSSIKEYESKELKTADLLWAQQVKERDGWTCVICGSTKMVQAHHIHPRERRDTRHNILNGVSLCCLHHKFSLNISPHRNAFEFVLWLAKNRPEQFEYCIKQLRNGDDKNGREQDIRDRTERIIEKSI